MVKFSQRNPKSIKLTEARKRYRAAAIVAFGGRCCKCGFDDHRALQFDHIGGGGGIHLRKEGSRPSYYKLIISSKPGVFQLLCANCNWIKRHELNETGGIGDKNSAHMRKYWDRVKSGEIPPPKRSGKRRSFTKDNEPSRDALN